MIVSIGVVTRKFESNVIVVIDVCREESDPRIIEGGANVQLRSFKTSVHNVEALVSYKAE